MDAVDLVAVVLGVLSLLVVFAVTGFHVAVQLREWWRWRGIGRRTAR